MSAISSRAAPALWFVAGLAVMLVAIIVAKYFEADSGRTHNYFVNGIVELLNSAGAAIIVIGGINAIIETGHWRRYFEEQLKDIVVQQNYLNTLDKSILSNIHVKLLQAQFKDSTISGDDSFFAFYNKNIHQYIGGPYREDATGDIIIKETPGDLPWQVSETIRFTCRNNGSGIQNLSHGTPMKAKFLIQ